MHKRKISGNIVQLIVLSVLFLQVPAVLSACAVSADKETGSAQADASGEETQYGGETSEGDNCENSDADVGDTSYQVKEIDMEEAEEDRVKDRIKKMENLIGALYEEAEKGDSANVALNEDAVHGMIDTAGAAGLSVTCGSHDYNMLNYEPIDECLRKAMAGERAETEFYEMTASGYFRYFRLQAEDGELTVAYANAAFNQKGELQIRQMEKFQVYDWEYTEKGWLIWEKALSRNQEMDMHSFFRILPLDDMCRELCREYISPVNYFCNNLFLTDWNMDSMENIEFNDLYDVLYAMKYGVSPDEGDIGEGIPKEEFEMVVQTYFDISTADLEKYARFDSVSNTYPWAPIDPWNRARSLQPFPEVVMCENNGDGTWTLHVEAVLVEAGSDCCYKHTVTMKEENGSWIYVGNDVDEEGSRNIPRYVPRRNF